MTTPRLASEIYLHNPSPATQTKRAYIVYFITGNPGLIEYYRMFLTHLYGLLTKNSPPSTSFHVFGRNLSGFEVSAAANSKDDGRPPFSLQNQIKKSQIALQTLVGIIKERDGVQDVRVILMGHSVGSYIVLEIIRRVRDNAKVGGESVRVSGGVCLFPTVTHIAKSDSGKKANPLLTLPHFALISSILAKALTFLIPLSLLTVLVEQLLSFPHDAAHTTASFIKSPHGVRQALHMARDEMREIKVDAWDSEIWGALATSTHVHPRPILRFLFAKKDHWVADETRDELIKARGSRQGSDGNGELKDDTWRPVMEIDEEEGWVHGFCIRQSVPVAERVFGYVRGIVDSDV